VTTGSDRDVQIVDEVDRSGADGAPLPSRPDDVVAVVEAKDDGVHDEEPVAGETAEPPAAVKAPAGRPKRAADAPLRSLTSRYEDTNHQTYLRRLEEAIKDPLNRNIALTGRYGAGKSSVLDGFEARHRRKSVRLAISTLAPDGESGDITNRIQKEIVKQLLYGASRKVGKNSRFRKIALLTWPKALLQTGGFVAVVGALLYLFEWLPPIKWTDSDEDTTVRVLAWVGAAVAAVLLAAGVRKATYGRFVSNVSAAGAGVTLSEDPKTFFDKYLDEIVHFFDREPKDIVIFEDLDRFEDPGIFEAVRELNILLNDTPKRRRKRRGNLPGRGLRRLLSIFPGDVPAWLTKKLPATWSARLLGRGVPLRFVYAVKDSLFEKLGADTEELAAAGDAAAAETLRANRTKFFDIVVPIVPFISHRNARELLAGLLKQSAITGIEPRLVNVVAQHATDMRLLRNICNEYLVFAEQLLEPENSAPGLNPSKLFALVAYKNFHLKDFENISRRSSNLDRLYEFHQKLVRQEVAKEEKRSRELRGKGEPPRTRESTAQLVGQRIQKYADAEYRASSYPNSRPYLVLVAGGKPFSVDAATTYEFWAAVAEAGALTIAASQNETGETHRNVVVMDRADLELMVPEGLDGNRWAEIDEEANRAELAEIDKTVSVLRSADFTELAALPEYKLSMTTLTTEQATSSDSAGGGADGKNADAGGGTTFAAFVNETMTSPLARELVLRGYLDRNFSLYAAQFYGTFSGIDVANFMVHHVQTNTMNVDYDLSAEGAVANLLSEAEEDGEDFTNTVAAYNVDIVNYLLANNHPGADDVVRRLVTEHDEYDDTFLTTYLTSGKEREELAARLARQPWKKVFEYLVASENVPDDVRTALVSSVLVAAIPREPYDLPPSVGQFVVENYEDMPAFIDQLDEAGVETVVTMLERLRIRLPRLADIDNKLRVTVVARSRYKITPSNLRIALRVTSDVCLDAALGDDTVYRYCLDNPAEYLATVAEDSTTQYAVRGPETLVRVLSDVTDRWSAEQRETHLPALLGATQARASIEHLATVPTATWAALANAHLFNATLANVERYRAEIGIDAGLIGLLEFAKQITKVDGDELDRDAAAVALVNTADFSSTAVRVELAASLKPTYPLPIAQLAVEPSDLFARMLAEGMVADDLESFAHFHPAGWRAIGPAVKASTSIGTYLNPDLVAGMVADVFEDPAAREKLGKQIASNVEAFVPNADAPALRAVAQYVDEHRGSLRPETVVRVASAQPIPRDLVLRLLDTAVPAAEAPQIVEVFKVLGGEYAKVSQPGAKFVVRHDDLHSRLLTTLKASRVIENFGKKRGRDLYGATVT
jgi:hypothetical protein